MKKAQYEEKEEITFEHYCLSLLMCHGIEINDEHRELIEKEYIPRFIDDVLVRWDKRIRNKPHIFYWH
jgi:hypothetical protein